MPEQYLLSQKDHDALKGFIQNLMQSMVNPRNRTKDNTIDNEEWLAPEVYIALTPSNGIPALQRNTTGTGSIALSDDMPGVGFCTFYRLLISDITGDPYLDPVGDYTQIVYNITTTAINSDSWILAIRDKSGSWIASPLGPTALPNSPGCRYIKVVDKICFVTITYDTTGSGVSGGSCIGPNDFGFALDLSDGDSTWINPSGALTAGIDVCTNTLPAALSTDSLVFYSTGGGFSLPPSAFLTGVIIEVFISCTPATPSITLECTLYDIGLSTTLGTTKTATPPFSAGYTVFGSASDLWGNTTFQWTTYHGCLIDAVSADGSDVDISIDHVRFTLCFPQGTITIPSTSGSGSRQAIKTVYQLIDLTKECSDPDRIVNEWCEIDEEDCCVEDTSTGTGQGTELWGAWENCTSYACKDSLPVRIRLVIGSSTYTRLSNRDVILYLARKDESLGYYPSSHWCSQIGGNDPAGGFCTPCAIWSDNSRYSSATGANIVSTGMTEPILQSFDTEFFVQLISQLSPNLTGNGRTWALCLKNPYLQYIGSGQYQSFTDISIIDQGTIDPNLSSSISHIPGLHSSSVTNGIESSIAQFQLPDDSPIGSGPLCLGLLAAWYNVIIEEIDGTQHIISSIKLIRD